MAATYAVSGSAPLDLKHNYSLDFLELISPYFRSKCYANHRRESNSKAELELYEERGSRNRRGGETPAPWELISFGAGWSG